MALLRLPRGGKSFPARIVILSFFLVYLCIGLMAFDDYTATMDEGSNRHDGFRMLNYVLQGDPDSVDHFNRFHGMAFSMAANLIELALDLNQPQIFLMRHLLIFLIFYLSLFFFFRLLEARFQSWKIALVGTFLLIITPKIFAHSFYNSMDAIMLSFVILTVYTQTRFLEAKTLRWALWHGLCCALAFNTRVMAVMFPLLTIFFFLIDLRDPTKNSKRQAGHLVIFIAWMSTLIYLLWPVLWGDPVGEIIKAFTFLSNIPALGGSLYLGKHLHASEVPWHYVPVWIAITTPISFLFFFLIGTAYIGNDLLRRPKDFFSKRRTDLLVLTWLFLPIGAVILFKANLYTSYRHLLFVYPALIFIGMIGLAKIAEWWSQKTAGRWSACLLIIFLLVDAGRTVHFMIKNHPYQDLYFNRLAGDNLGEVQKQFEMDYWGLSYREGFEFLAKNFPKDKISVVVPSDMYLLSAVFLPEDQRARFQLCTGGERFLMTNFHFIPLTAAWVPHREEILKRLGPEIYNRTIDGAKIFAIYRVRSPAGDKPVKCMDLDQYFKKDHLLGYDLSRP